MASRSWPQPRRSPSLSSAAGSASWPSRAWRPGRFCSPRTSPPAHSSALACLRWRLLRAARSSSVPGSCWPSRRWLGRRGPAVRPGVPDIAPVWRGPRAPTRGWSTRDRLLLDERGHAPERDAPVFALFLRRRDLEVTFPEPRGREVLRGDDVVLRERLLHGLGPLLRQVDIVRVVADGVGVALDHEDLVGMGGDDLLYDLADPLEVRDLLLADEGLVEPEVDRVDLDARHGSPNLGLRHDDLRLAEDLLARVAPADRREGPRDQLLLDRLVVDLGGPDRHLARAAFIALELDIDIDVDVAVVTSFAPPAGPLAPPGDETAPELRAIVLQISDVLFPFGRAVALIVDDVAVDADATVQLDLVEIARAAAIHDDLLHLVAAGRTHDDGPVVQWQTPACSLARAPRRLLLLDRHAGSQHLPLGGEPAAKLTLPFGRDVATGQRAPIGGEPAPQGSIVEPVGGRRVGKERAGLVVRLPVETPPLDGRVGLAAPRQVDG